MTPEAKGFPKCPPLWGGGMLPPLSPVGCVFFFGGGTPTELSPRCHPRARPGPAVTSGHGDVQDVFHCGPGDKNTLQRVGGHPWGPAGGYWGSYCLPAPWGAALGALGALEEYWDVEALGYWEHWGLWGC